MTASPLETRWPHATLSDEELAALAQAGDLNAVDQLLRGNIDRIHTICRRITCHPHDAQDATQDALVSLYRCIGQYNGQAAFATWLYRVATNAALAEVRRRGRRPETVDVVADAPRWAEPRTGTGLDLRLDIDTALSRLAPEFRAAVVLRDLHDLNYSTIAAVLDIPEGTVRSRIHRGRQALRVLLTESPP
ncbi:MAG: RNA polymerase sigma factor [Sporichthyaceae bacterium]